MVNPPKKNFIKFFYFLKIELTLLVAASLYQRSLLHSFSFTKEASSFTSKSRASPSPTQPPSPVKPELFSESGSRQQILQLFSESGSRQQI
jgi:hypothetical protein